MSERAHAAFISYRHTEPDARTAVWLHRALEGYRVPAGLAREKALPKRIGRVFRDEDELPASSDLGAKIRENLEAARFLIVVCSPRTPESRWVNEEIESFRKLGREDRILALLVEGEPEESFPQALRDTEPLAADIRPTPREGPRQRRYTAKLRILARLLDVEYDDLYRRDVRRRRRRRVQFGSASIVLLVAFLFLIGQLQEERQQRETAQLEELARGLADEAIVQHRDRQRHELAALLARQAYLFNERVSGDALREVDRALRATIGSGELGVVLPLPEGLVPFRLAIGPTGRRLAVAAFEGEIDRSVPGAVVTWDISGPAPRDRRIRKLAKPAGWVGFAGNRLLAATAARELLAWDLAAPDAPPAVEKLDFDPAFGLAIDRKGARIAGVGTNGQVWVRSLAGRRTTTLAGTTRRAHDAGVLAFGPDGRRLAGALGGDRVLLWSLDQPDPGPIVFRSEQRSAEGDHAYLSVAFSSDGKRLFGSVASLQGRTHVWKLGGSDWDRGHPQAVEFSTGAASLVRIDPTGSRAAAANVADGRIALWDPRAENPEVRLLRGHPTRVSSIAFAPDGTRLASASKSQVRLWDLTLGETSIRVVPAKLRKESGRLREFGILSPIHGVAYHPQAEWLALCSPTGLEGVNEMMENRAGTIPLVRPGDLGAPRMELRYAFTPQLLGGSLDSLAPGVRTAAFSADGVMFVAATGTKLRLWNSLDFEGGPEETLDIDGKRVFALAMHPAKDRYRFAAGSASGRIALWEQGEDGFTRVDVPGHDGAVHALAYSPDGSQLASASDAGEIRVWRDDDLVAGPTLLGTHGSRTDALAFHPEGGLLASGSDDGTLRVWDVQTRRETSTHTFEAAIRAIAFVDGGDLLVVGLGSAVRSGFLRATPQGSGKDVDQRGALFVVSVKRPNMKPALIDTSPVGVASLALAPDKETLAIGQDGMTLRIVPASARVLAQTVARKVTRNLTRDEWREFVGEGLSYETTCSNLPAPD